MRSIEMAESPPDIEMSFQHRGSRQLAEPLSRSALRGLYCRDPGPAVTDAELTKEIAEAIVCLSGDISDPDVEILLPAELLCEDMFIDRLERVACRDDMSSSPETTLTDGHLAYERSLALRCWERWFGTGRQAASFGRDKVDSYWEMRSACLTRLRLRPTSRESA